MTTYTTSILTRRRSRGATFQIFKTTRTIYHVTMFAIHPALRNLTRPAILFDMPFMIPMVRQAKFESQNASDDTENSPNFAVTNAAAST